MLFDSHAHYDDAQFDEDRDTLIPYLHENGVDFITNIGCDIKTSENSVRLAEKYPFMYAAVGFHPEEARSFDEEAYNRIKELLSHPKVVALGEIGLDYHYPDVPKEVQKAVFERQLKLAEEMNKPVIIHSRDAAQDTLEIIKKYNPRGVVHCFSGSAETAKEYVKMGMYIGITGVVTFKNARKTVEVVEIVPEDQLLIETDCPYLAPTPMRGKRCDSSLLRYTAEKIAEIKGVDTEHIYSVTLENAKRLYGIK